MQQQSAMYVSPAGETGLQQAEHELFSKGLLAGKGSGPPGLSVVWGGKAKVVEQERWAVSQLVIPASVLLVLCATWTAARPSR